MSGQILSGTAESILPAAVVVTGDRMASAVILDAMLSEAMDKVRQELHVTPGGANDQVGFPHFHLTLTVAGELMAVGE